MTQLKPIVCILFAVLGLAYSIWYGIEFSSWLQGIGLGLSTLYLILKTAGVIDYLDNRILFIIAAILLVLSIINVFASSDALNFPLQRARVTVVDRLNQIDTYCPQSRTQEVKTLSDIGVQICGSGIYSDQLTLIGEAGKSQHLGVLASIVDTVISYFRGNRVDACAVIYQKIENMCPDVFSDMPEAEREAMRKKVLKNGV